MALPIPESIKRTLRIWDSRWSRVRERVQFRGEFFEFYRTYWWGDASQKLLDDEIIPYFSALESKFDPEVIIDIGAATGAFSILAGRVFPQSTIYCFEPAERQRILLARNARLNCITNLEIEPFGLWNREDQLAFRTNGAESSFESVSRFRGKLPFVEKVAVRALDRWVQEKKLARVDLIKMDAEGAEIEILEGAQMTLERHKPILLIQAYHKREGKRTFERCVEILQKYSYSIREGEEHAGLLIAS